MLRSIALTLVMSLSSSLHAQNVYTWNGATPFADWSNSTLWLGPAGYPDDSGDWAVIADTFIGPSMDVSVAIGQLTLEPGAYLATQSAGFLYVNTGTNTNGLTFLQSGSLLNINPFGGADREFDTDDLTNAGGELRINDAVVHIDNSLANLSDSLITGSGLILLTAQFLLENEFSNDGTIRASGGTLRIEDETDSQTYVVDLDGDSGAGRLEVLDGSTLSIKAACEDFNGRISIGTNSTFEIEEMGPNFEVGRDGWFETTGKGGTSRLSSNVPVTLRCPIYLGASVTEFDCDLLIASGFSVMTFEDGAEIHFNGDTHIVNPSNFNRNGVAGEMRVNASTSLGEGPAFFFDWDGAGDFGTIISAGGMLTIDVARLNTSDDQFNAIIMIMADGILDVSVLDDEWNMNGLLRNGSLTGQSTVRGSTVNCTGVVYVSSSGLGGESELLFESRAMLHGRVEFSVIGTARTSIRFSGGSLSEPNVLNPSSMTGPENGGFVNEGVTRVDPSAPLNGTGISNYGTLITGANAVEDAYRIYSDGDLHIGDNETVQTNLNLLRLDEDSVLHIEIKDPNDVSGSSFDSIKVFPSPPFPDILEIDGELRVTLVDYEPTETEEFVIIERSTGDPIDGTFSSSVLPEGFSIIYDNGRVLLRYGEPCLADWNGNDDLNTGDFLAYLNDYNAVRTGGVPTFGDPDLAAPYGTLNTSDFLAFLNLYNVGCP